MDIRLENLIYDLRIFRKYDMSENRHIVYGYNLRTVQHENRVSNMMEQQMKEARVKLVKTLLDYIILDLLKAEPMHGYQVIFNIRKRFGIYLSPSTVYPLLNALENKRFVKGSWDLRSGRPRKVYKITPQGLDLLNYTRELLGRMHGKSAEVFQ
jgi:DNA-binding PadR family transcriptional regulator